MKLSTPQTNIWNLQKYYENTSIANICGALIYDKQLNADILQDAISWIVSNHDSLRLSFTESNGIPTQQVNERKGKAPCEIRSFQSKDQFDEYANEIARKPFRLSDNYFYRFSIAYYEGKTAILLCLHHLIADAWTLNLLAKHVDEVYQAIDSNRTLPTSSHTSYVTFLESEEKYFKSERFEKDRAYWQSKYTEKPEKSLIKLHNENEAIFTEQIVTHVPFDLSKKLSEFSVNQHISAAALFEAAMILYLARINEEYDIITIGVPVLNRSTIAEKQTAGMFISTMPLSIHVRSEDTVSDFLQSFYAERSSMYRHQKYPLPEILRFIREKHGNYGKLYDVIVSFQNAETGVLAYTEWYSSGASELPLQFHIDHRDGEGAFRLTWCYQTSIFTSKSEVLHLSERICYILGSIIQDINQRVRDVQIIPDKERQALVEKFNDTRIDYDKKSTVHGFFEAQARKTPDRIALVFQGQRFTYRELDEMSNSLAHELKKHGIGRGSIVPIISVRSWHVIVAMFAILKAGGAYMPVDPSYPSERIRYMVETAGSQVSLALGFDNSSTENVIRLDRFDFTSDISPLRIVNMPEDNCYVIFTSGSTGRPKAVQIAHKNLSNFIDNNNNNNRYQCAMVNSCKTVLADTTYMFDISVFEVFLSLLNGLKVVLTGEHISETQLARLIEDEDVDVFHCTPTKLEMLMGNVDFCKAMRHFRMIMVGAEVFQLSLLKKIKQFTQAIVYNGYGPTETTIGVAFKRIDTETSNCNITDKVLSTESITIGKPIANTQIYIVDSHLQLVPIGVAGELCIAGDGVGNGYLNRPDLTAEKFIPNPFATEDNGHGKIVYRTGDLARWREDGEIEFLGRIDTQVKIRGLRIELGEIENVIASFPDIQLTAAADKKDESGRQYLVGYYTSNVDIDEKALREHLASKLPKYMIPNYFVRLDEMPMTASGKTDRKRLPVPDFRKISIEYVPPRDDRQRFLCGLIAEILGLERFGITDDFFQTGGDSLSAILLSARATDAGVSFNIQDLYNHPTVEALCRFIDGDKENKVFPFDPAEYDQYRPLLERNRIDECFVPLKHSVGNVLLTGATGFLGAHILDALMRNETGTVFCLVREKDRMDAEERLRERLAWYFDGKYGAEIGNRIRCVPGDVTRENLSDELPGDIQTVIHAAASVKHYGNYDYFHTINTLGTQHVAEYAQQQHARMIHISTGSVSGNTMADDFSVYRSPEEKYFDESSLYIGQPLDNVYVRSKFEAERCVLDAMLNGLKAAIIRVGNLTNRSSDFRFQPNYQENAFLSRIKAVLEFGLFPEHLLHLDVDLSPVDVTAEGIVKIAQFADDQNIFHLYNDHLLRFDRMIYFFREIGVDIKIIDDEVFSQALNNTMKDLRTEYIYEAFRRDIDDTGKLSYETNIHIKTDFTHWFLNKIGFSWKEIDFRYLQGYTEYFRKLGYFNV